VAILQMPMIAVGIGGMMMFQSTGRWWQATICGMMQGIICCIPITFLIQFVSMSVGSIALFLWCPFIALAVSALTVFTWSFIYTRKHFTPDVRGKHMRVLYDKYAAEIKLK
jgi:Na+-driven multidrug efflux pump